MVQKPNDMNERIIVEIYQCLRDLGIDIEYDETVKLILKLGENKCTHQKHKVKTSKPAQSVGH
jgi:hypothetical protein